MILWGHGYHDDDEIYSASRTSNTTTTVHCKSVIRMSLDEPSPHLTDGRSVLSVPSREARLARSHTVLYCNSGASPLPIFASGFCIQINIIIALSFVLWYSGKRRLHCLKHHVEHPLCTSLTLSLLYLMSKFWPACNYINCASSKTSNCIPVSFSSICALFTPESFSTSLISVLTKRCAPTLSRAPRSHSACPLHQHHHQQLGIKTRAYTSVIVAPLLACCGLNAVALGAIGLGVDAWSRKCECHPVRRAQAEVAHWHRCSRQWRSSSYRGGKKRKVIRSGHKAGGSRCGTVGSWLRTCIGPFSPNDCRGWLGRLGQCRDQFGRLPLYLPRRRLLKSSLAQGRLD